MGILFQKMRRDLVYNKGRSISIVLILIMSTSIYGGLFHSWYNLNQTYEDFANDLRDHSVRFTLDGLDPSDVDLSMSEVEAWDYRVMQFTAIKVPGNDSLYSGVIYGIETDRHPRVNDLVVQEGEFFSGKSNEILFNKLFSDSYDLDLGENLTVLNTFLGPQNFTLKAKVFSNEYSYNVNPRSMLPDIRGFAVGWAPLDTVQDIFGMGNTVNEVLVRFVPSVREDDDKFDAAIEKVQNVLEQYVDKVTFTKNEDEVNTIMRESDVGSLEDLARGFGGVILLIALFTVWDNISKLIASQRNYIGTMRALGGSKKRITLHYTSLALVLGFSGVLIAIPLAWYLAKVLVEFYTAFLAIPTLNEDFIPEALYEAVFVNLGLVVASGFLASLNAANIHPREALSSAFISLSYKSRSIFERMAMKLPGMNSPTSVIPLRGLFRSKRKTALTVLTYSMSLILMIASLSFISSLTYAIDENYNKYEKYDAQVIFFDDLGIDVAKETFDKIDGIQVYEPIVFGEVEVKYGDTTKSTSVSAFVEGSKLRHIYYAEPDRAKDVVLGKILADDLGVELGDEVNIFNKTYKVDNIAQEMMAAGVIMKMDKAQSLLGIGSNITGIILSFDGSRSENDVKNDIIESGLPVGMVLSTQEVQDGINQMTAGMLAFVGIILLVGFLIVALFSFNTVVLEVMNREMEFVNLRALGASSRQILKVISLQTIFIMIFGSILAVPLGYSITDWLINYLMKGLMSIDTVISPETYASAILSAFLASMMGIWAAFRFVKNINLVDALRKRSNA